MNILALDCGLVTGFAINQDGHIESGVVKLKQRSDESEGMRFYRFWNDVLVVLSKPIGFNVIYFEKPRGLKGKAAEQHDGYITRIKEYCALKGVDYRAVSATTIKKHVTGKGNASKEAVKAWFAKTVGREPIDDNEADARALLDFAMNELNVEVTG